MRKINRYISRSVTSAIGMVLLVIMALFFVAALIDEMDGLRANYTILEMLIYIGFTLPRRLYEVIPFACLIGCLVGLGMLASSSELVIMRAAGVSTRRITWMVLKPVLWFIMLAVALGEFVIPYTDQVGESRKAIMLNKPQAKAEQGSMWNREGDEFMHFNAVLPNGVLYGVTRYKFDDERHLLSASFSEQAIYQDGYWQEENIAVTYFETQEASQIANVGEKLDDASADTEFIQAVEDSTATAPSNPDGARHLVTRSENLPSRRWETPLTPTLLNIVVAEPETLSIRSLYYYINYLKGQGLGSSDYSLAYWEKLLQPLATVSLVLIAISFIFGPLREVTMGQRIFTGVVFGVVFRLVQSLLGPSSVVFGFAPIIAVAIPILLCALLGLYLLNRAR